MPSRQQKGCWAEASEGSLTGKVGMHTYSIYYREDLPLDGKGLVIVREAFSWFALLIPLLWGLWYRLWLFLLLYLAISFFLQTVLEALPL